MNKRTVKRYIKYTLVALAGVALGYFIKGHFFPGGAQMGIGAGQASVIVKTLSKKPMALGKSFIAKVEAINASDVTPQVSGYIDQVLFKDGSFVKEGDICN